jgi:hypothetical protein
MGLVERLPQREDGGGQRIITSREDRGLEDTGESSDGRGRQKFRESCVEAHCQFRAMLHQRRASLHRRGRGRGCTQSHMWSRPVPGVRATLHKLRRLDTFAHYHCHQQRARPTVFARECTDARSTLHRRDALSICFHDVLRWTTGDDRLGNLAVVDRWMQPPDRGINVPPATSVLFNHVCRTVHELASSHAQAARQLPASACIAPPFYRHCHQPRPQRYDDKTPHSTLCLDDIRGAEPGDLTVQGSLRQSCDPTLVCNQLMDGWLLDRPLQCLICGLLPASQEARSLATPIAY